MSERELLELVGTVEVPSLELFDVPSHIVVMLPEKRRTAEVPIGSMGPNALRLVGACTEPEPAVATTILRVHRLCRISTIGDILAALGGEDVVRVTWGQMYWFLADRNRPQRDEWYLFCPSPVWAVCCRWDSGRGGWIVLAYPVAVPLAWLAGCQVVSRDSVGL